MPEVLPHAGYRGGGHHRPPPDVLRDAGQLLGRRLLQGPGGALRAGALHRGLRPGRGGHLDHRLRRRRGAGDRARRGGHRALACRRDPRRAHRAPRPRRQLLAGRPDRAVRPLLGALPRPRRRVWRLRRPPGRRHRPLPRVLEPGLHAVRAARRRLAHRPAGQEHRHRPWARAHGGDPPGRAVGVRHRRLPAAHRIGRGAVRPHLRRRASPSPARCGSSRTTGAAPRS